MDILLEKEKAADTLREFLKKGKNRITPERFEVLEAALDFTGHFGADELYISMKKANSQISRATVYNTLEILVQCSLVVKRNFGENMTKYESSLAKKHDHLICTECGKITEFENTKLRKLPYEICKELGFEFHNYSFNIFGRCLDHDCRKSK